ncbi:tyrosine-type recombinase/integrase [Rossellomorea sp. GCM10028870]|uniref:tyrosine-type recombinase/integrase n=1 Tax=Rossellomorea sp. GCM10028870 TaxID=3273426 RepID=UPI003607E195
MIESEECIHKFIEEYSFRLDEKTVDLYQKAVRQLLIYTTKSVVEVTAKDIRSWLITLELGGYKKVTIKTKLAGIKLFFKYCLEEEFVSHSPAAPVPFPELEDSLPHYLEMHQLIELRLLVEGNIEDRAIVEVLYATGIRVSELINLQIEDICWIERLINIQSGKRKKGRIVLFTRSCGEHLRAYLDQRRDTIPNVFVDATATRPAVKRTIQSRFERYEKRLGVRCTPHTLRHTFAAHLAQKGMPLECIQVLLGHNSPHQTQLYARLYSHARKLMYDEWM